MQVCTSFQTDNHASTPLLSFYGRMPFLPPNQQRQSTEDMGLDSSTKHRTAISFIYKALTRGLTDQLQSSDDFAILQVNRT